MPLMATPPHCFFDCEDKGVSTREASKDVGGFVVREVGWGESNRGNSVGEWPLVA